MSDITSSTGSLGKSVLMYFPILETKLVKTSLYPVCKLSASLITSCRSSCSSSPLEDDEEDDDDEEDEDDEDEEDDDDPFSVSESDPEEEPETVSVSLSDVGDVALSVVALSVVELTSSFTSFLILTVRVAAQSPLPATLEAVHVYSPSSDLLTLEIVRVKVSPSTLILMLSLAIRSLPSLLHMTSGCGSPVTFVVNVAVAPSSTA